MRACRPLGAVRYTNRLYFGPKRVVFPLARRVEKDWEWVGENLKSGREFFLIIAGWESPLHRTRAENWRFSLGGNGALARGHLPWWICINQQ